MPDFNPSNLSIGELVRVFLMVVVSILPDAEFGKNDHPEDASHLIWNGFLENSIQSPVLK